LYRYGVDDAAGLKAIGADVKQVATRIQRLFGRMIFVDGFVHCDPHPGNILVGKDGRVILLDHGVYRTLPDDVRRTWCRLWLGLIRGSHAEMRSATAALGVDPELTKFFSLVLALVPAKVVEDVHGTSTSSVVGGGGGGSGGGGGGGGGGGSGSGGGGGGSGSGGGGGGGGGVATFIDNGGGGGAAAGDVGLSGGGGGGGGGGGVSEGGVGSFTGGGLDKLTSLGKREVMKDVLGVKLEDQTRLFETMPRDLLMILKANNLLRYVNEKLGSPINRFRFIAQAAEQGLALGDGSPEGASRDSTHGRWRLRWGSRGSVAGGGDGGGDHDRGSARGRWLGTQVGALLLPVQLALLKVGIGVWVLLTSSSSDCLPIVHPVRVEPLHFRLLLLLLF
jgi:hypothetical protein